ncbi:hypothetical protein [Hoeflea prorocentri]|uniref:Uncharacterized protein n=1 Tax=Hoeflea prorocentri TaxID=1922333 RepID=A0A9X3UK83_9HYPH|nr:hypothetical protein [Hoeflea prorocentri]MCY6382087.1 hypothetical protein [Hoeflea prorocentri]MDA5399887.1 hypothetical protein [Hoeflea prorocentri]
MKFLWQVATGLALALLFCTTVPLRAQDNTTADGDVCASLGDLSGVYRTSDGSVEAKWMFGAGTGAVNPGDPFTAEHTYLPGVARLGAGPHYFLFGRVGEDCTSISGTWRALFSPSGNARIMSGAFTASIAPGTVTIISADDDPERSHDWLGTNYRQNTAPEAILVDLSGRLEFHGPAYRVRQTELSGPLAFSGERPAARSLALSQALTFNGAPPTSRQIALTESLKFHGEDGQVRTVEITTGLSFGGKPLNTQTVSVADALSFSGRQPAARTIMMDRPLAFRGKPLVVRTIDLTDTLLFQGKPYRRHSVTLTERLAFSGKPQQSLIVELTEALVFAGDAVRTRIVDPKQGLQFSGTERQPLVIALNRSLTLRGPHPGARDIGLAPTLSFTGAQEWNRRIAIAVPLAFHGPRVQSRAVDIESRLLFEGASRQSRQIALPASLEFAGKRIRSRIVALEATLEFHSGGEPVETAIVLEGLGPTGAGPCGDALDTGLKVLDIDRSLPETSEGITADYIGRLRSVFAPYQAYASKALERQAECMETRLAEFRRLTGDEPHALWLRTPAFNAETFYSNQIAATRNAALYLRQIAFELEAIEILLRDEKQFHSFGGVDEPAAANFGLVTDSQANRNVKGSDIVSMRDFELMAKHIPANAEALTDQRNLYLQRKLSLRFGYLEELLPHTIEGLADWTQVDAYVKARFLPQAAEAIDTRLDELKLAAGEDAALTIPQDEFASHARAYSGLTQVTGNRISGDSFADFMNGKVRNGDFDPWPDPDVIRR